MNTKPTPRGEPRPGESPGERNLRLFDHAQPVVVITGSAAPRVGRRIAEYFLQDQFRVVFHAHQATPAAQRSVLEVQANRADSSAPLLLSGQVEQETEVAEWVAEVLRVEGRIDCLVNAAAIWEPKSLEQTRAADFEQFFRINALGTALCCTHFGLAMARQPSGGAIVNIGDWAVARPYRDFAAYFLSKGSIATLTQSMAVELASRNPRVRVNAVLPGPVQLADEIDDQRRSEIAQQALLQCEGSADDVARSVLFLATSPFITGVCLPVDGGRSIYAGPSGDSSAHPRSGVV